jgi:hypothetical protein
VHYADRGTLEAISEIKKLAVVVPESGSFTVYFDRANATMAPAVIFGLLGAAIASAHNTSLDNAKIAALAPKVSRFAVREIFIEALTRTFKESGKVIEWELFDKGPAEDELRRFDAVLTMNIKDWGLRLPAQEKQKPAAFLELRSKLSRIKDGQVLWDEDEIFMGQKRHFFSEYEEDKNILLNELRETTKSAGSRMASRITFLRMRSQQSRSLHP